MDIRNVMMVRQKTLVILSVLLLAPLVGAVDNSNVPESDIRDIAASNWYSIEPSETSPSALKSLDYEIHLPIGSFDPLQDEMPKSRLDDSFDYRQTGMAVVQLWHHTGDDLYNLVENHDVFVLDNLGSSTWLVRLSTPSDLSNLQSDDSVRWAGPMMPGWRVSENIDAYTDYISAVPAVDLKTEALEILSIDLVKMGADEAWCGKHLCEAKGDVDLESLAGMAESFGLKKRMNCD